jgi:hypothetical protein
MLNLTSYRNRSSYTQTGTSRYHHFFVLHRSWECALNLGSLLSVVRYACGCMSVIYKECSIYGKRLTTLSVYAYQRLILVTDRCGPDGTKYVVCAEPSPDEFGTLAIGTALNTKIPSTQQEVGASASLAETASAHAIRTKQYNYFLTGCIVPARLISK